MSYNIDESPLLEVNDIENQISCQESQRNLENTTPSPTSSDSDESCKICYEVSDMIKLKCGHEICKSCLIKLKNMSVHGAAKNLYYIRRKKIYQKTVEITIARALCAIYYV